MLEPEILKLKELISYQDLFDNQAVRIAPPNEAFVLAAHELAPMFINTENLVGGYENAQLILKMIDKYLEQNRYFDLPRAILAELQRTYIESPTYRKVIDELIVKASQYNPTYISGGERRDWLFSILVAYKLNIPSLHILKDRKIIDSEGNSINNLGDNVLHISDLIAQGSSCLNLWIPAIEEAGGKVSAIINVVDKGQEGVDLVRQRGIKQIEHIYQINQNFFKFAEVNDLLTLDQIDLVQTYFINSEASIHELLTKNHGFLLKLLNSTDEKTRSRTIKVCKRILYEDLYYLSAEIKKTIQGYLEN